MGFDGMVLGGVWVGRLRWERDEDRRPASRIYEGGRKHPGGRIIGPRMELDPLAGETQGRLI